MSTRETAAEAACRAFGWDVAPEGQMTWAQAPEDFRITFRKVADAVLAVAAPEPPRLPPALLPEESLALTVALAQVLRGETPGENVAAMCVLALARLDGRHDWTTDGGIG